MTASHDLPRLSPGIVGYGLLWGDECVRPGSRCLNFRKDIDTSGNVTLQVMHDRDRILADTDSGHLRLRADRLGLRFTCDLPDSPLGRETLARVRHGGWWGCSAGFSPKAIGTMMHSSKLVEVSLVDAPANRATRVAVVRDYPGVVSEREDRQLICDEARYADDPDQFARARTARVLLRMAAWGEPCCSH